MKAPKKCQYCLRRQGRICGSFIGFPKNCGAYIDDKSEFERREKERKDYNDYCNSITKPA